MGDPAITIVDVLDEDLLRQLPLCADPRFDHRSCDYWEDDVRGSKAARASWWQRRAAETPTPGLTSSRPTANPFAATTTVGSNPFAPRRTDDGQPNPFAARPPSDEDWFAADSIGDEPNPFAPPPREVVGAGPDAPRKLQLLDRGRRVFGSYAKVLLVDDLPAAYAQFGPLSAYPRARHIRELYPHLPSAPLPAVITCIASSAETRDRGLARALVMAICADLATRGFAAVETYPDLTLRPDEASAASPAFWERCGFSVAMADDRYPVMRFELT